MLSEENFWGTFINVYNKTKEIYIKSEEYDTEFCSIIQPIKEQRDALDHIVRSYSEMRSPANGTSEANLEKIDQNFNKAIGHIYRAYYDSADIFTIILRQRISELLNEYSYAEICSCWDDYKNYRKELNKIPKRVANLRFKKEVKANPEELNNIFNEYDAILNFLCETLEIALDLAPKIFEKSLAVKKD